MIWICFINVEKFLFQIEEEIEEVTEYVDDDDASTLVDRSSKTPKKKVVTTKTSKPTSVLTTPYPAIRGDIDCVLADLSNDVDDKDAVPFPEFGVDIVVRKGWLFSFFTLLFNIQLNVINVLFRQTDYSNQMITIAESTLCIR